MKYLEWLASNWYLILVVPITIITVYFSIRTYRTLKNVETESRTAEPSELPPLKSERLWQSKRAILSFVVLIVVVSLMVFSVMKKRIQPLGMGSFRASVEISDTLTVGDDIAVTPLKTTLIGSSSYTVDLTMTYKNQENAKYTNVAEGAEITFPRENAYDFLVLEVRANLVSFSITKK